MLEMPIRTTLLPLIVISLLIVGSSVDSSDSGREAETLQSKISTLELDHVKEAEKELQELKLSFELLQRTNDEQARALELAEKELKRAKLEASSKFEKLTGVLGSWLPPWRITHSNHVENLEVSFWKQRAKQSIIALINKTTETMVHAKRWSEPHMGSAKNKWVPAVVRQFEIFTINMVPYMKELSAQTIEKAKSTVKPHLGKVQTALPFYKKWVPAAKQQLETIMINMQPYMKKLSTKTIEVYEEVSKSTLKTHFDQVQEMALSYYKEAWSYLMPYIDQFLKPYINQLFIVTKPCVEKLQNSLKSLTEYAACICCTLSARNNTYHTQVKSNIEEHPRKHKLTRIYATLTSVMAFVLFGFSVFFLCKFLQSIFVTKKRKQLKRTFHASEPQQKPKRRRAES